MKKYLATTLALFALAGASFGLVTNTITFGAYGTDWDENWTTNNGVSPPEYSITRGPPYRYTYTELSNTTFTVTFTETNGVTVYAGGNWLYASTDGAVNDRRLNSNEVLRLKVSYSDPSGKLQGLRVSGIRTTYNTNPYETMVFSDGVNSTNITDSDNEVIFDYDAMGLDQLSTNNIATWELLVSVDDTLGGGTNFTEAGMGSLILEYVADTDEVPAYTNLTPAFFDFVDNDYVEFDRGGPGATMTRSNSWGSPITITTVEIVGQDGTSATNGIPNLTNIQSQDNLGVNSANNGPYSNESRDFNPNEAWVISFDADVYLVEIDLASVAVDTEMTMSSPAFADFVMLGLGDDNTSGTWDLLNTYVPAGAEVTFEMTSTTNASDTSLRIDDMTVQLVSDVESYDAWVQDQDLVSIIDDYEDDPDNDTVCNLSEFALGGDPLVKDAETILPVYGQSAEGGTNWLNYVYRRRINYPAAGLDYFGGSTTDLIDSPPTNTTEEAGSVALDAEIESVTNRVSTDVESAQFMQLMISVD